MEKLNKTLETNTGKIHIKRNFTLNNKSDINVWLDQLHSELSEYDLTEYITNPEKFREDMTDKTTKIEIKIRGIILSHVDTNYYKKLLNVKAM